jgi:hypothetical protein
MFDCPVQGSAIGPGLAPRYDFRIMLTQDQPERTSYRYPFREASDNPYDCRSRPYVVIHFELPIHAFRIILSWDRDTFVQ